MSFCRGSMRQRHLRQLERCPPTNVRAGPGAFSAIEEGRAVGIVYSA